MTMAECRTQSGHDLNLVSVSGQGVVLGRLLEMSLTQTFRNPEPVNVEVVYTFPLPFGAVLLGLEAVLNGQALTGVVTAKGAARETYEVAISEGNTSIMLSKNYDGSFTLELGNLLADEVCSISLKYAQILQPEQGGLRLMLPCTIAPRYGDAVAQGKFEPHAVPLASHTAEYPFDIRLTVKGSLAEANVASPSHAISVKSRQGEVHVQLGAHSWLDRDFVLILSELTELSCALISQDLLSDGESVVMASLTPAFSHALPSSTSLKILVDCSGSMAGDSIEAAKRSLQVIVNSLTSEDWFTLSKFGDSVRHRSDTPWAGGASARASALRWVEGLKADMGGTEMNHALKGVMSLKHTRPSDVLLITDGEVHAIDDILATAKSSGHRLFVVGIGASPAEGLLRRLGNETGGSCEFVAAGESAGPGVLRMFNRLRGPAMTDLQLAWKDTGELELLSQLPTAVFDGDTVTVFAKVAGLVPDGQTDSVELQARNRKSGGLSVAVASAPLSLVDDRHNTLARLGAQAKHLRLLAEAKTPSDTAESPNGSDTRLRLQAEATQVAEKYQLVTDHTNFVMVHTREEGIKPGEMPELRQVASMAAAGWSGMGRVGSSPRVAFSAGAPTSTVGLNCSYDVAVPSVWRANRARVAFDTLDDHVALPSFSRKQTDSSAVSNSGAPGSSQTHKPKSPQIRPVEAWHPPAKLIHFLNNTPPGDWPKSFAELEQTGLWNGFADQKKHLSSHDDPEHILVLVMLLAALKMGSREWKDVYMDAVDAQFKSVREPSFDNLVSKLIKVLKGMSI